MRNIPKLPWKSTRLAEQWIANTRIGQFGVYRRMVVGGSAFGFELKGITQSYWPTEKEAKAAAQAYFEDLLTNPI